MPLYELMREPGRPRAQDEPELQASGPEPDRSTGWPAWLSAGYAIRLPVGYVLVVVAVVVLLVVGAYVVGHQRAEGQVKAAYEAVLVEQSRQHSAGLGLQDPLEQSEPAVEHPVVTTVIAPLAVPEPQRTPQPSPNPPVSAPAPAMAGGPIVVTQGSDPRQSGLHYFVIAETREAGAVRLAQFCRQEGLEAYVVRGNNPRLRRVILLPGFTTRLRTDPQVARLIERIFQVGAQWKANERGASDLRDAYMARYDG
jgi:hypothetical protein